MFNTDMRTYNYFTIGGADAYGQPQMPTEYTEPTGAIKMAVYATAQSIQDNILYKDCQYIGLTLADVQDTYILEYGNDRLKVLYVNPKGRYKQVFMARM